MNCRYRKIRNKQKVCQMMASHREIRNTISRLMERPASCQDTRAALYALSTARDQLARRILQLKTGRR